MMGYGPDWGMMGGWSGGAGWGPFGMIIWLLVLAALIAGIFWLVRSASHAGSGGSAQLHLPRRSSGLDVLEERYARGEINRDEYLQKKRDITG